jgi:kinesin family protein 15
MQIMSFIIYMFLLKVRNLKEEVRSYQAHKQSEAEFQAVEEMLTLDTASRCDGNEGLCPRKCQLKKVRIFSLCFS